MGLIPKIVPQDDEQRRAAQERAFIRQEAKIGAELFGPIPAGHHREFFCLDEHTWVWHEEWTEKGKRQVLLTRYRIRPGGVMKMQDGKTYHPINASEAHNLHRAIMLYQKRVGEHYHRQLDA